jgi:hypothetical protein
MRYTKIATVMAAAALGAAAGLPGWAASHSDAPLIKLDPQANLTDVYAFIGRKATNPGVKVLNVVVQVHPFCEPGDGVMYDRFDPDARYSIHITNPTTGATVRRYDFRFSGVSTDGKYKNLNTILSYGRGTQVGPIEHVGDARQNFNQAYNLTMTEGSNATFLNGGLNLWVPPPNVGKRTTPHYNDPGTGLAVSGATDYASLDRYTRETVYALPHGEVVFAGTREDSFYADTPGIFDLLDPRILGPDGHGQTGGGVDGFKGFNVLVYAIQIPVDELPGFNYGPVFGTPTTGVGVYASVSRKSVTLRTGTGVPTGSGPWVQVNRMGNPLFNEVLVALKDKDNYNATAPTADSAFATYAENPEVAVLINAVFGTNLAASGRVDLKAVYIPDVLRVATTTDAVPLAGQAGFSRLSVLGADTTNGQPSGWPNGRRFGDDVVDIALTAVASGPTFQSIFVLGDNVTANDQVYNQVFPYAATPHAGSRHSKDSD